MLSTYPLKESRDIESLPICPQIKTKCITGSVIPDDNLIPRVHQCIVSSINLSIRNSILSTNVNKFQISRMKLRPVSRCSQPLFVHIILINFPIVNFRLRLKKSIGPITPNFAQSLANVIVTQQHFLIVKTRNLRFGIR